MEAKKTPRRFQFSDGCPKPTRRETDSATEAWQWLSYAGRYVTTASVYDTRLKRYVDLEELYRMSYE